MIALMQKEAKLTFVLDDCVNSLLKKLMLSTKVSLHGKAETFLLTLRRLSKQGEPHKLSTDFNSANDFVHEDCAWRHHIEPMQLRIFFETLFLLVSVLKNGQYLHRT